MNESLLMEDDFHWLNPKRWIAEIEQPASSRVYTHDGRLWLDSSAGMTIWLDRPLDGAYRIEFEREVFAAHASRNARLSDLNQFWAAKDPTGGSLFTRSGALAEYDSLDLYYVGMGGNGNTTTRMRRYDGRGARQLLGEYLDPAHLLQPARRYQVRIEVNAQGCGFWIDGQRWFSHQAAETAPISTGYFGFRSTWSVQAISHFRVWQLSD
jgi:hypothetical protein